MYSKIHASVIWGIEGQPVEIETNILRGLPNHVIVGLPSTIVKEAKERIKSALKSSGIKYPDDRIIQNLYPANLKKDGSHLDLAMAMGIYACTSQNGYKTIRSIAFLGELTLEGGILPIQGILSLLEGLKSSGVKQVVVPDENFSEASYVLGIDIFPYKTLLDLIKDIESNALKTKNVDVSILPKSKVFDIDFSEIIGQQQAIRAVEIAMTGFHNLLIIGPPGCGKSMIAQRIETILPPITLKEKIEITKIYSISEGTIQHGLIHNRPFRAPHHTISRIGLVGGGTAILPGEISKAHLGILYLDEIGEFKSDAIEALREPLSNGTVNITRGGRSINYPSKFTLIATMNPCPCGHYLSKDTTCTCSHTEIKKYMGKLSGPILDRIDMTLFMDRVTTDEIHYLHNENILSDIIRERVREGIAFREARKSRRSINSDFNNHKKAFGESIIQELDQEAKAIATKYHSKGRLSMRSLGKLVGIARTIADLEKCNLIEKKHLLEAYTYLTSQQMSNFFS
ncbi:YifB family Mg chelatase-like AAA ATPase [Fusibacter bizertensis]